MDLLVLLVGTNPLPAWVTFSALHRDAPEDLRPRKVLLVHSRDSYDQAARLRDRIDRMALNAVLHSVGDDAGDPLAIRAAIKKGIAEIRGSRTVLLDYTGGTKQMAVQAFAACQELVASGQLGQVRGAYLDAAYHRLRFSDDSVFPVSGDLRQCRGCATSLPDLLELHGCAMRKSGGSPQAPWAGTAGAIWEAVSASDGRAEAYAAWKQRCRSAGKSGADCPNPDAPPGFTLPSGPLAPIAEAFLAETALPLERDNVVPWEAIYDYFHASSTKSKTRARDNTVRFFDGSWLESLLTRWIHDRLQGTNEAELQWGVYAERSGSRVSAELDVVMLRGYQLFLFSCTTASERHFVKNKAFEAIHRARQFGGDEARSVVVTLLPTDPRRGEQVPTVTDLGEDIATDTGGRDQLRIWGIDALRSFESTWTDLLREERLS